jgi:hypothetical protein
VEQNAGLKHNRKDRGDGRRSSSAEQKQTNQTTTTRTDKKKTRIKRKTHICGPPRDASEAMYRTRFNARSRLHDHANQ